MRLFEEEQHWTLINDGNKQAFKIFQRHYTYGITKIRHRNRHKKNGTRMIGPGETILLIGIDGKSIFAWKKQKYSQNGQTGVACVIFRNEGTRLSSDLILQAEQIAWRRWPGERLFTYVNPRKIRSTNPGSCFKHAGWKQTGITKARKLIILEKLCKTTM